METAAHQTDKTVFKFIGVGVVNTVIGCSIMFGLYNIAGFDYWVSSAVNYLLTSIISFALNKYYTFRNHEKPLRQFLRFIGNVTLCYIVAYGLAKPIVFMIFNSSLTTTVSENIAMTLGIILFSSLNYLGQRFFVFRRLN